MPDTRPAASIPGPGPEPSSRPVRMASAGLMVAFALMVLPSCMAFVEYGSETDFGVGVRGSVPMDRVFARDDGTGSGALSRVELAGSLSRAFPTDASWTEASADAIVPLIRLGDGAARMYVGGGLHLGRLDPDVGDADTKFGANLIGGLRFEQRFLAPQFEIRGSLAGADQLKALIGVQLVGGGS